MAYDFHTLGGFLAVIRELNSTSPDVQASAAWVIGTAVQNVREAQDWGVEDGALPKLVHALRVVDHHGGNDKLERKLLYAMASMLRNNNWAKSQLGALGATTDLLALVSEIDQQDVARDGVLRQMKVSAKVFRLISDVVREAESAEAAAAADLTEKEDADEVVPLTVLSTSKKDKRKEEEEERHFDDGAAARDAEKKRNDEQHKGGDVLRALVGLHQELVSPQWFRAVEHWLSLTAAFPDLLLRNLETYLITYSSLHEYVWDYCARNPAGAHVGTDPPYDQGIWESGCLEDSARAHIWPASGRNEQDGPSTGSEWAEVFEVVEILGSLSTALRDAVKKNQMDQEYAKELGELLNRVNGQMPHTRKLPG
jgi:hypothetical protein